MIIKYGNYTIPEGRAELSRTKTVRENEARQPIAQTIRMEIDARLGGTTTAAAMDSLVAALLTAFSTNGKDLLVMLPDGTTASQLSLYTATAIGGVRVIQPPSFPSLRDAAYVTWLPFTIILEAEYPITGSELLLVDFEETITFEGGGPQYGWLKPLVGNPQRQLLRQRDTYRATQSGSAIGAYARPTPPLPLWLNMQNNPGGQTTKRSPKRRGSSYVDFFVSWEYSFESSSPLVGNPNVWS